ncbi:MAG: UbiD family decarboxylase [Azospirillaceae bacterium]
MSVAADRSFGRKSSGVDVERFSLKTFLARLRTAGELDEHDGPFDLADLGRHLKEQERAVLFRAVGPEKATVVGNLAASRARIAMAFDTTPDGLFAEVMRRLQHQPGTVEIGRDEAPVQEVVLTDEADLTRLPVHLQHGLDGAPYVSASMDIVKDPATGLTNVGMRRLMLRGRREAGVDLVSPSDLRAIYEAAARRGERTPVAFVVGSHPVDHIAAVMRLPIDEVGIIASLRDSPLPVVRCVTNDLLVPADAEYVLEGYLDEAGHVEAEGPFGEFLGYYGGVKMNPVFHLTAITHRRDPVFQSSTIAGRRLDLTDTAQLCAVRTEVSVWRALETAVREPLAIYATTSSGGMFNVRIAMRQRVPGEARNAISAAMGCLANVKHVFVVDPDIDIFSDAQMDWALATRFQANRDLMVEEGFRTLPLDPSLGNARTGAKAGFDCTLPLDLAARIEARIPEAPSFEGERFDSIEAALADGPKTFMELMVAVGSRDGREIVLSLDEIRQQGRLGRDGEGKWLIKEKP